MKTLRNHLVNLTAGIFMTGLALNFNACTNGSSLSPKETDSSDQYLQTKNGPVQRLRVNSSANALFKGSPEDTLFYKEQFMPAKKRGNIRLGNTYYGHSKITFFRKSTLEDMNVQFQWLANSTFEGMLNSLEFGPHGTTFNKPVRVQLSYKRADLSGIDESNLQVYYFNEGTGLWDLIGGEVDTENKRIIVYLDHFSRYALGGE